MAQKILTISRRAGDTNVGQTLIRMARLAAAAHLHDNVTHGDHDQAATAPQAQSPPTQTIRDHREVDR